MREDDRACWFFCRLWDPGEAESADLKELGSYQETLMKGFFEAEEGESWGKKEKAGRVAALLGECEVKVRLCLAKRVRTPPWNGDPTSAEVRFKD